MLMFMVVMITHDCYLLLKSSYPQSKWSWQSWWSAFHIYLV